MEKEYFFDGQYYNEEDIVTMIRYYKQNHINIVEEQWYNILLRSNVNDLSHMCNTNQLTHQICQSNQFWVDKGMPLAVLNISTKISDRIKLFKIVDTVDKFIQLLIKDYQ